MPLAPDAARQEPSAIPEPPHYSLYGPYTGGEPCFHARDEVPALADVEAAWKEIRDEAAAFLRAEGERLGTNFDPYGFDVAGWRTLNFQTYLRRYPDACRAFPRTLAILEAIPGFTSAFLNVLDPHTRIPTHPGDSNTIWRFHLGLVIPGDVDLCGIQVGSERRGWREGEAFAFCDAHPHRAWNDSDRPRVVLVFDVMKPAYRDQRFRICGRVLGAIALTLVRTGYPSTTRLPEPLWRIAHLGLGALFAGWLRLQDRVRGS